MVGLRKAQKEMTRKLLLDKGLELFNSQGYASTTVDDIAAGVGTTRTTFYLHFPSKADLVRSLVDTADEMMTSIDDPSMTDVVASNDRDIIKVYLGHKFDQWAELKPFITATHQAAAVEPDIQTTIDLWFDRAIDALEAGLKKANRFDAGTRRIRCALAFGELEFLSRRWMRLGWTVDREVALETMVDSWCHLLVEQK
jgi:AcrR family transcriptional regulator